MKTPANLLYQCCRIVAATASRNEIQSLPDHVKPIVRYFMLRDDDSRQREILCFGDEIFYRDGDPALIFTGRAEKTCIRQFNRYGRRHGYTIRTEVKQKKPNSKWRYSKTYYENGVRIKKKYYV